MRNASSAILVDSNILVYAFDPRDLRKQRQAITLLTRLAGAGRIVLSVQCLSEFFNAVTRRIPERMPAAEALVQTERFARACRVLDLTPAVVLEGCRAAGSHPLSVWDALIWAAAKLNQVPVVLTGDMRHGRTLEGVSFQNPFVPEFDMALLD